MKSIPAWLSLVMVTACSDANSPAPPPPPPESFTAHVTWCAGLEPVWVAFQDSSGAWTQALPQVSKGQVVFTHTFFSNRGAIATAFEPGGGVTTVGVVYGTPQELETRGVTTPRYCSAGSNTLQGSVAGLTGTAFAEVWGGFFVQSVVLDNAGFALQGVEAAPRDFLATRVARVTEGDSLTGIILRRAIIVPDGATLPVFDFTSAEAFQPEAHQLSLGGLDVAGAVVSTRLITSSLDVPMSLRFSQHGGTTLPYPAIAESRLLAGDLQVVTGQTHVAGSLIVESDYFRTPQDRTLAMGGPVVAPQISTVATTPTLRARARFGPQSEYNRQTSITYQQGQTVVVVVMTSAYATLIGGYDLEIPELSTTANFNPAWALHGTAQLQWSAQRDGGTLGVGTDLVPFEGAVQRSAATTGVFAP